MANGDVLTVAREEMIPLLEELCSIASDEGRRDQQAFFDRIRLGVENARDEEDLAAPLMELSTSAFVGFQYSPSVTIALDRVLAVAQTLATTLSASSQGIH